MTDDDKVQLAIDRFDLASEAWAPQIALELADLRFVDDPDGQWPAEIRASRAAGVVNGIPIPARPCLTIDLLDQPIQQTVNTAKNARLSVNISPKGGTATQDTAEMLQGLYRHIEIESNANMVRMWALERAAKCGRGWYRVLTQYANDDDDLLDVRLASILNQGTVYPDPFYQKPDASDMRWCLIVDDMPWRAYREEYPDSKVAAMTTQEFTSFGSERPDWMGGDKEGRTVRVCEHFWVEESAPSTVITKSTSRKRTKRVVKWQKVNAVEALSEEQVLDGRYIPLVLVVGKETNVNGVRRFSGIVRKSMDPCRVFNYTATKEVEAVALSTISPWLAAEGQFEGYERQMAEANNRAFPYLYYKPKMMGGELAPPPVRNVVEPAIQAISQSKREARQDVHDTTGVYAPSLGEMSHAGQSGKAIANLKASTEQGTSNYLDSLASISMPYEARIVLDLIPKVYDTPGRNVQILTGERDDAKTVMVNRPFVAGPNGQPQAAPPGTDGATHYDLSSGSYAAVISVGKGNDTRRQQGVEAMAGLAQAAPQTVPMWADLWIRNMDFPGHNEIADRLKKMLPPPLQDQQGQQDPQAMAAQLAQMQQQIQQLQPLADDNQAKLELKKLDLQQTQMELEQKQRELQANVQLKAATEQQRDQLEKLKLSVEVGLAQIKAQSEAFTATQDMKAEALKAQHAASVSDAADERNLTHAADEAHTARIHERAMADHEVANRPEPVSK